MPKADAQYSVPRDPPPGRGPGERGDSTRSRLERAAIALIAESGWQGVTTRRVAERAGVGAGLVHYHYDSLEALLVAAVTGAVAHLGDELVDLLEASGSTEGVVARMLTLLADREADAAMSLVLIEAALAALRSDRVREALAAVIDDYEARLGSWLAARGHPVDAGTRTVVLAALDGLVLRRALDPTVDVDVLAPPLMRLLGAPS